MKTCSRCRMQKAMVEFHRMSSSKDGRHPYCKECTRKYMKDRYDADPEEFRRRARRYRTKPETSRRAALAKYRMTPEEYDRRREEQQYRCAICGRHESEIPRQILTVDHDHRCCPVKKASCGKCVRGLLCYECNFGIGQMHDDADRLEAAAKYLRQREMAWK